MTKPATPSAAKSGGDDRNLVAADGAAAPSFEEQLGGFWKRNSRAVIVLLGIVIVGAIAKGGWEYMEASKERDVEAEYAAATTSEKLRAFAAAHAGHSLAGVARLRLADEAYAAGKSADAVSGYQEALSTLPAGPLASRAKLGLAMSRIQSGKAAEGEASLKQLAADASEPKSIRIEASYHLASLASQAGNADDVRKYSEQVMQIDPSSQWTQRAFMLRAALPPETAPAVTGNAGAPAVKLPGK